MLRIPYIPPASPILVKQPPTGPNWLHEIKWDGWRCQIIKDADGIRIHTRRGNDWTDHLPGIVAAAVSLKARSFSLDGELIGADDGYDFYTLPAAIRRGRVTVVAFDLLYQWQGSAPLPPAAAQGRAEKARGRFRYHQAQRDIQRPGRAAESC